MIPSTASTALATFKVPTHPYVLLVDDHWQSLRRLREAIELDGHACLSATSASEAIRLCEVRTPQVVITDLAMPNLDGRGLARWVNARFPSVPLILVTGEPLDAAALAVLERTFSAVYLKPVDVVSLLDRLGRMMPARPNASRPARCP